ncbi:hypothetical protein Tco_0774792, partial [Tanacetum coccineum]
TWLSDKIDEALDYREQGLHVRYLETAKDTSYLSESGEPYGWTDPRRRLPVTEENRMREHPSDTKVLTMKMEILLEPTLNKLGRNPVKEIPLKRNLPDHMSVLTDPKDQAKMEIPRSSGVNSPPNAHTQCFQIMKVIRHFVGKCVATEPDTSSCNLHDRSARRSRALRTMGSNLLICFTVQRSRDGASGASTATKCSLAQKRPCGILTGLLTSGGLEFGNLVVYMASTVISSFLNYGPPREGRMSAFGHFSGLQMLVGFGAKAEEVEVKCRGVEVEWNFLPFLIRDSSWLYGTILVLLQ